MAEAPTLANLEFMKEATGHLRWRRLSDEQVNAALTELAGVAHSDSLAARFESPASYAGRFGRGKTFHPGYILASVLAFVGFAVIGVSAVRGLILHTEDKPLGLIARLLGSALVIAVGFIVGAAIDRRLPTGFTT